MAEESDNIFGNTIFGGRDNFKKDLSDTDARPGGSENSVEYDLRYNQQGENEYTNLPENANQLEEAIFQRRRNEHVRGIRSELRNAMKRIQFWPQAGRFVLPKENTFASHLALVREGNTMDINFDPKTYLYFDKIIATKAKRPELFNPNHKDYAKYESLRENLAVLRNDLMGIYMDDGSFDPGDEKYLPKLVQIAVEIGDALYVGNNPTKVLFNSLDKDIVNVEGEGAAHIYQFLTEKQTKSDFIGRIKGMIFRALGQPDREWNLPPIETTAFSDEALNAAAPQDELCSCSHSDLKSRSVELATPFANATREEVASITNGERREAVNHGRTILDWLRNIQFSNVSLHDMVDTGNPAQTAPEREAINMMIDAYYDIASTAFKNQPELFKHPQVQAANEALETLEHGIALMAKLEKPKSLADTMQISSDVTQQPEKWHELAGHTVDRLMQTLKGGLDVAVGSMEQQQADMAHEQEELADRQVELAMANHAAFSKGRRKRKSQASGAGGAKQKKLDQSIRADDYALGQGAHAGRMDTSRDGIVDKPVGQSQKIEAQIARARMQGQAQAIGAQALAEAPVQAPTQPSQIDSDLVKQLGKAIMQMQKDSDKAAANLPPEVVKAMKDQPATQRLADNKSNNPKRPQIG